MATSTYRTGVKTATVASDTAMETIVPIIRSSYEAGLPYAKKGLAVAQPYVVRVVSISEPLLSRASPLVSYTYKNVEPVLDYGKKRLSESITVGPLFEKGLVIVSDAVDQTLNYCQPLEGSRVVDGLAVEKAAGSSTPVKPGVLGTDTATDVGPVATAVLVPPRTPKVVSVQVKP